VYIYFGFGIEGLKDPLGSYSEIEDAARDEIMKYGGCISHHHGVGKLRKKFMPSSVGATGIEIIKGLKHAIDPSNVFATGNLV
jgi:alkyldihydroxyacetonephosphate synthase